LKRYTDHLITVFDSDQAGIQANLRSLPLFLEEGLWAKTVLLPKGEDPDTFLRKGHVKEFEKGVAEAIPLFDFFLENLMKIHDRKSIPGRVNIAEEGIALVRRLPEGIQRTFYLKALAEKLDLQEPVLHEMLRSSPKGTPKDRRKRSEDLQKSSAEEDFPKPEEMVLRLMARYPEVIGRVSEEGVLDDFGSPVLKKLAERLQDLYQRRGRLDLAEALEGLEEDLKKHLSGLALEEDGLERGDQEKVLDDCIQKIHERRLKRDRSELLRKIKEAEKQPGEEGLEALLLERQELLRKEDGLRRKRG
jgi:DNA primase